MSKHTPGPWEAKCRNVCYKGGEYDKDQFLQWEVCGPEEPDGRGSFYQSDALLIAAAPELLEALKKAEAHLHALMAHIDTKPPKFQEYCWEKVLEARAAIAKAEGAQ